MGGMMPGPMHPVSSAAPALFPYSAKGRRR